MHSRHAYLVTLAAALAFVAQPARAGDLTGRVTDSVTGRPLPNATVTIKELSRSVTADRGGEYRISGVPAGDYAVEVTYVGYTAQAAQASVPASGTAERSFALLGGSLEEVTVTGFRLAQATALQDKMSANVIKDSVTADDAGKLPDRNAAEALSRVTGISVTVDEGEGRYVSIRGIDPSLNTVTLDHQIIGTPEGDTRRIAMDTIPSNLLAKLEVVKSVSPDMDGNSIGGTINIVTPSAYDDPDGRFLSAAADVGYYDMNGKSPYGGSVAWGQTFGAERQWGVMLSGSYLEREFQSENVQGGDPWEEEGAFLVPDQLVLRDYRLKRIREGFVANFEFRPSDAVNLYLRNLYNIFKDTELRSQTIYDYRNGDLIDQTPTSGTFTEGEGSRRVKNRLEKQSIQTSTLGGDFTFGAWTLGAAFTYGDAGQETPTDAEWRFDLGTEMPMTYDTSSFFFNVTAPDEFQDASQFEFDSISHQSQDIDERLRVGQVDLAREFQFGASSGSIKFGGKYVDRTKDSDQHSLNYDGFNGTFLASQVSVPGKSDFYCSERCYTYGPRVDWNAAEAFFDANEAGFELNPADTTADEFGADYHLSEKVSAGYLMATLDFSRITLLGGVRIEQTDSDFEAFSIQFDDGDLAGPPTPVSGSKSYTNWLPGVQARFEPVDNLVLRAAWTNTIGRPSYEQTVPFRVFETEPDGVNVFQGEIEEGNPELDPIESTNYDLAVEWYLRPAGIVSGGVFYKDLKHPIFTRVQTLEDTDFEGRFYSELQVTQPQNASSGEILGFEFNFQQQFRTLPSPFDGLGIALGYTYSDSEATVFDRSDKVPFFLQSKHVGNVSLFYEKHGFEFRLAYAYRSEYLEALGDSPETDLYIDDHGQLDLKASYSFNDTVTAFVEMQNLTDEPVRFYSGVPSRLAENEMYSWNALAGIRIEF